MSHVQYQCCWTTRKCPPSLLFFLPHSTIFLHCSPPCASPNVLFSAYVAFLPSLPAIPLFILASSSASMYV